VEREYSAVTSLDTINSIVSLPSFAVSSELPPIDDSELAAWLEAEGSFGGISPGPVGSLGS
jgi:hypothetical protein